MDSSGSLSTLEMISLGAEEQLLWEDPNSITVLLSCDMIRGKWRDGVMSCLYYRWSVTVCDWL